MSKIPDPDLRLIAEEMRERKNAPHGLPTYDWRYTEETGRRVRLTESKSVEPIRDQSDEPGVVVVDFEDGPACRFMYNGTEYEAAWRRWYRVVVYRMVPKDNGT